MIGMRKRFIASGLMLLAANAAEQTRRDVYIQGGLIGESRDAVLRVAEAPFDGRPLVSGFVGSVGLWMTPRLGLELEISRSAASAVQWTFSYEEDNSMQRTVNRDVPVVGLIRVAAFPGHVADVNLVAGAGLIDHRTTSYTTATCGRNSEAQLSCIPVDAQPVSDTFNGAEPALEVGADLPLRVSSRFSVTPTFRFVAIHRREWLTGFSNRGPLAGSGRLVMFGVSANWDAR